MPKSSNLKFLTWICILSLLPFITFFFFTVPCSDDIFYRNYAQDKTLWQFLIHHYNTWTGRYFSNLLMATNPFSVTSDAHLYPWTNLALFLLFASSVFFLLKTMILKLMADSPRKFISESINDLALASAVIFIALFLHKMPRTADSLYWFAGSSSHLFPMSLILLSISVYFHNFWGPVRPLPRSLPRLIAIVFITLISFLVSGSNETLAVQWIFTLAFGIFYRRVIFQVWNWPLYAPLTAALVGFAILYLAPGNIIRANELKGGHDLTLLLIKPWGLILETTVRFLSLPLLTSILIFFPFFKKINTALPDTIKTPRSLMCLGLFGLGLFALTFVPSIWTMGGLPPRRVLNNTYLLFLLYGTFLIILFAHKLKILDRWCEKISSKNLRIIFALSLLFFFNNFYAWKDLIHLPKYVESLKQRDLIVTVGAGTDLILTPLNYFPTTFFYEDITVRIDDYRNIVFAEYFHLKSVQLSKDYAEHD